MTWMIQCSKRCLSSKSRVQPCAQASGPDVTVNEIGLLHRVAVTPVVPGQRILRLEDLAL
jgi:hypothetical protein